MKIDLCGTWSLSSNSYSNLSATVPGSVLSTLLAHGLIEDPFYRDNEAKVRACLYEDYTFKRAFNLPKEALKKANWLFLDGIDTAAKVYVNGVCVAEVCDMHLRKRILLDNQILREENEISVEITSPYRYIEAYDDKGMYLTFAETEKKSPVMRKANYMFGWDWGPNLADMGIHKDIYILSTDVGFLREFRHDCEFLPGGSVRVSVRADVERTGALHGGVLTASLSLPENGFTLCEKAQIANTNAFSFLVENPKLWYPVGFGEPTLYDLVFTLLGENGEVQEYRYRIGLRDVKIDNSRDEHGLNFCVYVNGVKVFLKGANYIPQDNILQRVTPSRTRRLLRLMKDFNHNVVRVWGGGYYPDDDFYDTCDEMGLLVSQDLMIACAVYNADDKPFMDLLKEETRDALRRIRHHASIFMFSGDNECEDGVRGHGAIHEEHYKICSTEHIIPTVKEEISQYFLRSSPTSDNLFILTNDEDNMDTHYWEVWHGRKPFEAYQGIYPRMLSEFGCQSFPLYDTVCKYALPEEHDLFSPVMAHHQKNYACNDIILHYTNSLYKEPKDFKSLVFQSILAQAEGIKTCVEHLRRNKPRCNGAIYWQLNDCWPGQSWSSIDYYFGLKALHYYSKKFYAPHLVCLRDDGDRLKISVSNDTAKAMRYCVRYRFMNFDGETLCEERIDAALAPTSCQTVVVFKDPFGENGDDKLVHLELYDTDGNLLSENFYQRTKDRDLTYPVPRLTVKKIDDYTLSVTTDTYTKNVFIEAHDNTCVLSDNYFHLLKGQTKTVTSTAKLNFDVLEVTCLNEMSK